MVFHWLKTRGRRKAAAQGLYQAALAQSRREEFYIRLGVADTMDGRFDLLCLHAAILINRLNREGAQGQKLAQALFDILFTQMDYGLREIGVGDLGVPKHMQKMMKAFNGRMQAYAGALQSRDAGALADSIARNLYRRDSVDSFARTIAAYALAAMEQAAAMPITEMMEGRAGFPPPPAPFEERMTSHA